MNSPEEAAEDFIRTRWRQIAADLRRLDVLVAPADVFEDPKAAGDRVQLRPKAKGRVGIVVASAVRDVLYGEVRLEVREMYSYAELRADPTRPLRMLNYRYQFSYFPELLVESATLQTTARSYWGDLLLSHRRIYRFDGEDVDGWNAKDRKYRNEHFVHHFHPGPEEHLRWPVSQQPTVLAVASFVIFSLQYDRWLTYATRDPDVLAATQLILPHVEL